MFFEVSRGVPRSINLIADGALVFGFADETRVSDAHVIDQALEHMDLTIMDGPSIEAAADGPEINTARENGQTENAGQGNHRRLETLERRIDVLAGRIDETGWGVVDKRQGMLGVERDRNDAFQRELTQGAGRNGGVAGTLR